MTIETGWFILGYLFGIMSSIILGKELMIRKYIRELDKIKERKNET